MCRRVTGKIVLFFGLLSVLPVAHGGDGAENVVDAFHASLTRVMGSADELGFDGRFERLEPAIDEYFDLPFISRLVSGRYWKSMELVERLEMIQTFGTPVTPPADCTCRATSKMDFSPSPMPIICTCG